MHRHRSGPFACVASGFEDNGDVVRGINVLRQDGTRPLRLPLERYGKTASSRNPPKRLRLLPMPHLSATGISGIHAGEDVK